jgi:hypothetical protein
MLSDRSEEGRVMWYGWLWRGDTWQQACQGDNLGSCGEQLAQAATRLGVSDRLSVMTTGFPPTFRPSDPRRTSDRPGQDASGPGK